MELITTTLLAPFNGVTAAFTTRHGGVSTAPFSSANLAFHVGDDSQRVVRNHDILSEAFGYTRSKLIHMRQIHSDRIVIADESMTFDTPPECDALITDRPGVPLMVMSADCTPILLYDPNHHAIGAVHAGRAGALKEILPKTIETMKTAFGSEPAEILIAMGPSIGGCCYEINPSIADEVTAGGYSNALRYQEERIFLDVNTILLTQLKALNIQDNQIEMLENCTACECERFFSYRADAQHTGRIAGIIMLGSA